MNPVDDIVFPPGPRGSLGFAAVLKDDHCGNSGDIERLSRFRVRLGIEFCQDHLALQSGGSFGKMGAHHLARLAPRCPEVNHDRQVALGHKLVKRFLGQFDWSRRQNWLFALSTHRAIGESIGGDPIPGQAISTDNMFQIVGHGFTGKSWMA